ncbi:MULTISPECIES: Fic family protein [unclassified Desulfovibrio]|uniref:Fic family protein n=1 Tax=unclassified Desulfovibrio TaxID=2593640 RepID=UPI000F5E519D|nr:MULTISPECIES: Fic family protein [unclassified Desulfovibrio]RRD69352.1 Fic family protein [Desulfovibrio sp. OH1209_COT-279]RRD86059.1 Fic family protein [Desulfovibrio sp. OH1186_COT-070]
MPYIHERPDWPCFRWNMAELAEPLAAVRHAQGLLLGRMSALGFSFRAAAGLETLTQDVVKSSAIEGEFLDVAQVRSSLARRLGVDIGGLAPVGRNVEGVVEMMLDATQRCNEPLTAERLFGWHAALFPSGYGASRRIAVGAWRTDADGPMQVVSGYVGHEKVHFEAPAAERLADGMSRFLEWFNDPRALDPVLKAGIAHLWFVTLHPFEDGNGRMARAIADCALARADGCPQRFYSMSARIERERKEYYAILERTQKGDVEITPWLRWFVDCLGRAVEGAGTSLAAVMRRARFWQYASRYSLNERQRSILGRLLEGFEGKLTSGKYARLAKCSPDTALRDIRELMACGLLQQAAGGGRSTSYDLPADVPSSAQNSR